MEMLGGCGEEKREGKQRPAQTCLEKPLYITGRKDAQEWDKTGPRRLRASRSMALNHGQSPSFPAGLCWRCSPPLEESEVVGIAHHQTHRSPWLFHRHFDGIWPLHDETDDGC